MLAGSEPVRPENPDPEVPGGAGGAHDPMRDDVDGDEAMVPRVPNLPPEPSARQIAEHELTGHAVYRSWCRHCVASKGRAHAHSSREEGELPEIGINYGFFGRGGEDVLPILCVKCRNSSNGCVGVTVVDRKEASDHASSFQTAFIKSPGFQRILVRSNKERSLLSLIERVMNNLTGVELVQMTSPEGDHAANGLAEVGVREINSQTRVLRSQLEQRLGNRIDEKDPLMSWIPRHAAKCASRYRLMDDGRTPGQRRSGKTWKRPVVEFGESVHFKPVGENNAMRGGDQRMLRGVYVGHHERASAAIFLTPGGVKRGTRIARMLEHERWDRVFSATWQLQTFGKVLEKRFEVKKTRHIGFYASDAKELKILNRTIKTDVLNDEMTLEADMKLVEGSLESMKLTGAKGVDSPRVRKNDVNICVHTLAVLGFVYLLHLSCVPPS